MKESDPSKIEKLLRQYHECIESFHHFERTVWQIPSITVLLISAVVAAAYTAVPEGLPRVLLLFIGAAITGALWLAIARFTYCMKEDVGIIKRIRDLEKTLGLNFIYGHYPALYEDERPKWRFWYRFGASQYLNIGMALGFILTLALAISELVKLVGKSS